MSENKILTQCFDKEELSDKKRPETVRWPHVRVRVSCLWLKPGVSSLTDNRSLRGGSLVGNLCRFPLTEECHDSCMPSSRTRAPRAHTLLQVPSPPHWYQCSASAGQPVASSSLSAVVARPSRLFTLRHSSPHRLPVSLLCPRVCLPRRPPSSKPVWLNSWRSSCPRSHRTCAASSPMTPNKQV